MSDGVVVPKDYVEALGDAARQEIIQTADALAHTEPDWPADELYEQLAELQVSIDILNSIQTGEQTAPADAVRLADRAEDHAVYIVDETEDYERKIALLQLAKNLRAFRGIYEDEAVTA